MSFQGSLNELPLSDIVQLVAVSGKTGMFSMTRASEKGYVYLQNGQITHAKLGEVEGEDAIYALALWSQGSFQFSPGVESEARTISRSKATDICGFPAASGRPRRRPRSMALAHVGTFL